jgi:hypothetical protein
VDCPVEDEVKMDFDLLPAAQKRASSNRRYRLNCPAIVGNLGRSGNVSFQMKAIASSVSRKSLDEGDNSMPRARNTANGLPPLHLLAQSAIIHHSCPVFVFDAKRK